MESSCPEQTASSRRGRRAWAGWCAWPYWALALAALHGAIAFWEYLHGLSFAIDPGRNDWNWFWQVIPSEDLLRRPWQSLWLDHAQPPGFSLWGWAWLKLFGAGHFPGSLQLGYVLLGAAVVALTYKLALALSRSTVLALAAGLGMALNPSLFYFECYILYEPLVIFLLTASAWALWRALAGGGRCWLAVYLGLLGALVMTRTLYHLVFILGGLASAWPLLRAMPWRRRLAVASLALALPAGWYARNLAQYGFFGASSWYGFGLYKCVETQWSQKELLALIQQGSLPRELSAGSAYDRKISYYRQYGYDKPAAVALLGRDDFHNINVPALSRTFFLAAKRLIARDPWRYLKAVHLSYQRFCRPPSRFAQVARQRAAFIGWEPLVANGLYGKAITDAIEIPTRIDFGSLFYFYFPSLMLGGAWWAVRSAAKARADALAASGEADGEPSARARAALMAYFVYACLYVAVVGNMMESGENERFRFATEPMTLIIALMAARAIGSRLIRQGAARYRAD